jgi:hypothetical protein
MSSYPPPPPPGYGAPPPPPPPGYGPLGFPAYRPTDGSATAALVVGIASIVLLCACQPAAVVAGVVALVVGLGARRRILASGGALGGDGLALSGVIIGAIGGGLGLLFTILLVAYIVLVSIGAATGVFPLPTPTP